ncbi:MAG: extracellular solute-binding protein [Anaerolineae bacterium]|nr:extracellular solute-binding protein [Thermoflexales bacterium]MDW8408030.1 extracellular solute-binding protein [Anaerolineae bacterium]
MSLYQIRTLAASATAIALVLSACAAPAATPIAPATTAPAEPTAAPAPAEPASGIVTREYAGSKLTLASQTDQFIEAFRALIPKFEELSGIDVTLDELGYVDLRQKATADFVGKTANYDLITVDIVWSGEYGQNKWTVDLTPLIERDKAQLALDDILPVMWTLGKWGDGQWAYPLAGYANILNYRTDLFAEAGVSVPKTLTELQEVAAKLTQPEKNVWGIGLLGAKGPAVAQDFMAYVQQYGSSLLDKDGKPAIDTEANLKALEGFKALFNAAPPDATGWWWGDRNDAFSSGKIAMMLNWSTAIKNHKNPDLNPFADKIETAFSPLGAEAGKYGFGGWGIGINADSKNKEAAWMFIKWITSPEVQKEWVDNNGSPIRRSTLTDPELVKKYPWFPILLESFEKGDGDYRPREPWYSKMEDVIGSEVNAYLVGQIDAKTALANMQKAALDIIK